MWLQAPYTDRVEIDRIREACRNTLAETRLDGVVSLYLFGSFADHREHRDSDVDLGLLLDWNHFPDRSARFDTRLELTPLFEARLRHRVDLLILNDVPATLARRIALDGIGMKITDPERDRAWRRQVMLVAPDLDRWLTRMRKIKLEALLA